MAGVKSYVVPQQLSRALVDLQGAAKGSVEEHHARGYMLRKRGDFHSAILHYSKALEAQPDHFSALFNRGFSYDKVLAVL